MKKIILLIALCFIFVTCDDTWKDINKQFTLDPREVKAVDFATNAKQIRWTVDCVPACDFYFMTLDDFQKMTAGRPDYTYFQKEVATTRFTGEWKEIVDI